MRSHTPPPQAGLELFLEAGRSSESSPGRVWFGVITGASSDHDTATRDAGRDAEPHPCVPAGLLPDLGQPPFSLPVTPRGTYALPLEPVPSATQGDDLWMLVSQPALELLGRHAFRGGALCLGLEPPRLPASSVGALTTLHATTGTALLQRRAPVTLRLAPQTAPSVQLSSSRPGLLELRLPGARVELHAGLDGGDTLLSTTSLELVVRASLDTSGGFGPPKVQVLPQSATATPGAASFPEPAIFSADPVVHARVVAALAPLLGTHAVGALLDAVPLPVVASAPIERLRYDTWPGDAGLFLRVRSQGDGGASATPLDTFAFVDGGALLGPAELRAAFTGGALAAPAVFARLSSSGGGAGPVELSTRIDSNAWSPWSTAADVLLADPSLWLQGRHTLAARSRLAGDWRSEDLTPATIDFVVDTVPPELSPFVDAGRVELNGFDVVSPVLEYAWGTDAGLSAFSGEDSVPLAAALAATGNGAAALVIASRDPSGNVGVAALDLSPFVPGSGGGAWGGGGTGGGGTGGGATGGGSTGGGTAGGAEVPSGCGCGASERLPHVLLLALWLMAAVARRRPSARR